MEKMTRRTASKLLGLALTASTIDNPFTFFANKRMERRPIPSTGELLPIVGLGTWQTFDVGQNEESRKQLSEVLMAMKQHGGSVIDSSPMYGTSEQVVGDLTKELDIAHHFFYATKVWTSGENAGISQMVSSMEKMGRRQMDLMQIHNLVDWKTHMRTLREWKEQGKIRYWGVTHYTDSAHDRLIDIIKTYKPDFAQFNYSINSRHAEGRLLDTAKDNGVAVITNRPYDGGSLFRATKGKALPKWAEETNIESWGQFFLKYILSHPAVNLAIPGTSKPHHVIDNMKAGYGRMPDEPMRKMMVKEFENI